MIKNAVKTLFGKKMAEDNRILDKDNAKLLQEYYSDIQCDKEIMQEKEKCGRVSTITMRYLREKYGLSIADRALSRTQKRFHSMTRQ